MKLIVRAQKRVSKGRPKTLPKSCSVDHKFSSIVWSHMWLGSQPNTIVQWISIHARSLHVIEYNKPMVVIIQSVVVSQWFCVRPTSKRWFLKIIQVTMKHDPFHVMWTLHPILHSHTPFVPHAQCEANLDWLDFFHRRGCLKMLSSNGHVSSISCVKWP
jgi:hypothetical protein